jgi:ABC-type bacteriocin/lantibiotic exporter with double-glycine peptidase domain
MQYRQFFVVVLSILCLMATTLVPGEQHLPVKQWRSSTNGGINALYCYLQINGIRCQYSELRTQQMEDGGPLTAATLVRLAAENGVSLQVRSLTMGDLKSCPMPVLVHMDGATPEAGAFLIIIRITDNEIFYIDGPTASIHSIQHENFRRVWSGIALLPARSHKRNAALCGIGLCLGFMLPFAMRYRRRGSAL